MKSSTIRRANLSKEKIAVLESLAKYRRQHYGETANNNSSIQARPLKERELDVLWQSFKQHSKNDKSPGVYLATGFIVGAVTMLLVTTLLNFSVKTITSSSNDFPTKSDVKVEDTELTFIPADTMQTANVPTESYTVKAGDTLESIIIRFYGTYSTAKETKIKKLNQLKNPNALQIGQKLTIPLN